MMGHPVFKHKDFNFLYITNQIFTAIRFGQLSINCMSYKCKSCPIKWMLKTARNTAAFGKESAIFIEDLRNFRTTCSF